jgi:predicted nucleotidyltransferase
VSWKDVLTPEQHSIGERVLAEEDGKRVHLVVSLSGAHAYGFPSPDSDLDLKAIHIEPAARLLSFRSHPAPAERTEVIDGVEIDYSSNEIRGVLAGIARGNGNYLERILGHLQPRVSSRLEELKPLVRAALSKHLHHHYRGFATNQWKQWEATGFRSAKKLLYVLRTALTGAHVLRTGEIVTDLGRHLDAYGFSAARELIEQKKRGERIDLAVEMSERWQKEAGRVFTVLDEALAASPLPEEPRNLDALDDWLLRLRQS